MTPNTRAPAGMPATAATSNDLKLAVEHLGYVIASSHNENFKQDVRDLQDRLAESARLLESPAIPDRSVEDALTEILQNAGVHRFEFARASLLKLIGQREHIGQAVVGRLRAELFALRSTPPRETSDKYYGMIRPLLLHYFGTTDVELLAEAWADTALPLLDDEHKTFPSPASQGVPSTKGESK